MLLDWLPLIVAVVAAVLAFVLGLLRLSRDTKAARNEELRRRRVEAYAAFCAAAIEYRRALLGQWFARDRLGGKDAANEKVPQVAEDVRSARATAWSRYYEVLMLCNDSAIAEAADTVLQTAASMTRAADRMALDEVGDLVHAQVARFALVAGEAVRARKQGSAMPPHQEQPVGTAA